MCRKFFITAILMSVCVLACGQARISTKKMIIKDLPEKTMMIVESGIDQIDSRLEAEFARNWRVSTFESCGKDFFLSTCSKDKYYYTVISPDGMQSDKTEGLMSVEIVKGGFAKKEGKDFDPSNVSQCLSRLYSVVSVPLCPEGCEGTRDTLFFPCLLRAAESYAIQAIETDLVGYAGLILWANKPHVLKGKKVVFSREDMLEEASLSVNGKTLRFESDEEIERLVRTRADNTVVGYAIWPRKGDNRYCYKMLFDCESGEICYFQRHKINPALSDFGFLTKDLLNISKLCNP